MRSIQFEISAIFFSKNRGRVEAAIFVSEIICRAPHIVSINATFNIMPPQSVPVIFDALDVHFKGVYLLLFLLLGFSSII